jgi:glycosyltransferase involved in cell wall biosynthesis
MINILYLFVTLPIGGAEEHLLTVIKNTDLGRYNPTVCCIREKGAIGEEIENSGFHLITLQRKSKKWDFRIVTDILRIIREREIQLIHTHLYHANMYGRIAAFIAQIPVVSSEHNAHSRCKPVRRVINRLLAGKTNRMIAVSRAVKDYIVSRDGIGPSKVEVIYNGIDIRHFTSSLTKTTAREKIGVPADCFLIGTVGRISEEKGHIYLIDALRRAKDIVPDLRLIIVGSGPLELHLKKVVSDQDLDRSVLFAGFRRDVPDILKAMDVFAFPSLREGFPVALLEAMASCLPVVATPVGGIAEIIADGINGLLVQPRDDNSLAKAIITLYQNPALREALGLKARETVIEKFNAVTMVKNLDSVYRSVLAESKKETKKS